MDSMQASLEGEARAKEEALRIKKKYEGDIIEEERKKAGSLSNVLGATTTRGFLHGLTICLLNRWKYWAPVVGCTTSQLTMSVSPSTSLLSVICRNLSGLQELCSGPAPSMPCGNNMVRPLCKPHLDSPLAT